MVLDFSADDVAYETDILSVGQHLGEYALELALLGDITVARDLMSAQCRDGVHICYRPIRDLLLPAWDLTSEYPTGVGGDADELKTLRQQQKEDYDEKWGRVPEDLRGYDRRGLEACLDDGTEGSDACFADATTGWTAMLKGERLVKAFEISVRLNSPSLLTGANRGGRLRVQDLDDTTAEVVKKIVGRWNANSARKYLAEAPALWPLYSRGILADALGLSGDEVHRMGQEIYETFETRLEKKFVRTQLSDKTMSELLEIANSHSVQMWRSEMAQEDRPTLRSDTFYKSPAKADDVSKLEKKLGVTLPDDYKEFLSISNGFSHGEHGIWNGYFHGPGLHGSSQVSWISESYFQLPVDLLDIGGIPGELSTRKQYADNLTWDTPVPLFDRVLEIGSVDIEHVWLIQPDLVQRSREVYKGLYELADDKQKRIIDRAVESFADSWEEFDQLEWCCASWAAGGSADFRAYRSFRRHLEETVVRSMARPDADE